MHPLATDQHLLVVEIDARDRRRRAFERRLTRRRRRTHDQHT